MAEQWLKYFQKLPQKVQQRIEAVLIMIRSGNTGGLDVKELKGYENTYRVRLGDLRLIYKANAGKIIILKLGSRGDVYKDF